MCPMLFYYYALCSLKLQLDIIFTHVVRFKHMTRHFNSLNLKIYLITFNCQSDCQKHCWFKTLIQASCALSVFRILICENHSLCEGQNVGSKMGCQQVAMWACGLCFSFSFQTLICTSFLLFCSFQIMISNSNLIQLVPTIKHSSN